MVPVRGVWSMSTVVGGGCPYKAWKGEVPMEEW